MIATRNLPGKAGKVIDIASRIYFSACPAEHGKALDVEINNATFNKSTNTFMGRAEPSLGLSSGLLRRKGLYWMTISEKQVFCSCPHYNLRIRPGNNRSENKRNCKHLIALATKILISFGSLK
tara:strand:- start:2312 stop:2680 length:369 start_codon:yes stop_codon:yes gene_type:complete